MGKNQSAERLYKVFIYFVLIMLAVCIIVPVAWVFLASIKENSEFYGNPWAMPKGVHWQNFVEAWNAAKMGEYMVNSVLVTAMALAILLVVALPAAYCLSRFKFRGSKFLNVAFMAGLFINVNYIVVPIFLMLRDGDTWLKKVIGDGFLLKAPVGTAGGEHFHNIHSENSFLKTAGTLWTFPLFLRGLSLIPAWRRYR